ncbi:MAG TPA: glycosyltransferase [Candidatus Marinimicrobia bacterium]|nr:glycosyltransferase [Candidatus Neomarinimicrobiota bacterium]
MKTTILLYLPQENAVLEKTVEALAKQRVKDFNVVFFGEATEAVKSAVSELPKVDFVKDDPENYSATLNKGLKFAEGDFVMLIDNRTNPVFPKYAALEALLLAAERNSDAGLFYTDYELEDSGEVKEIKLLYHHQGRVRDNQDYGKLFFIRKCALEKIGGFDENLKYKTLYDMRLKISEYTKLIRISNRYSGSYYRVVAASKKANVFDYLLAGKDLQIEAENVVTEHLKRIGAYLAPGFLAPVAKKVSRQHSLTASIIIPVGKRPEFIGTAIESVQAQTVKDVEIIVVVNGGESDPTADVVRSYMPGGEKYDASKPEVRLIVVDINSIGYCLDLGAKNARGKYYVQLDSDDRLKPDAVEKILAVYESDPNIGMVVGSYEVWEKLESGELKRMEAIPVVTHDEWTEENGRNNLLRINGAGAPRSVPIHIIEEMGWFSINDDEYARNYGEDYEMVNKIAEHYRIGRVWDPIYEVIRHSGGTDHAIDQNTVDRNDNAKDDMRKLAIRRRIAMNKAAKK